MHRKKKFTVPSCTQPNKKSILKKNTSSTNTVSRRPTSNITKTPRFDENNIKETYRPANKDYGFDKINEPNTPFERAEPPVDARSVAERLLRLADEVVNEDEDAEAELPRTSGAPGSTQSNGLRVGMQGAGSSRSETSTTSSDVSVSFEEKRRRHIQSEFLIAKQKTDMKIKGHEAGGSDSIE